MSNLSFLKTHPCRSLTRICSALALLTALAYILIALGFLPIGDSSATAGDGSIIFVAAGCYFIGGLLIQLQRRWLWMIGITINLLVVLFYFSMYLTRPEILLSVGGLTTKSAQVLLEVALLILIVKSWIIDRKQLA